MANRVVPGVILMGLGLGLFGSQLPGPTQRLAFGAVLLALWAGTGLAVLAGRGWARLPGLVLAAGGIVVGAIVVALANGGEATWADLFFTVDRPEFSWIEVLFGAAAFGVLSVVVLVALFVGGRSRRATQHR